MIPYTLDRSLIAHCTLYQGSRMTNMWTMKSVGIGKCQLPNDKLGRCWLVGSFRHTFRLMLHYFLLTPPICLEIYRNSYLKAGWSLAHFTPCSQTKMCTLLFVSWTCGYIMQFQLLSALQHFSCWVVRSLQLDWSASIWVLWTPQRKLVPKLPSLFERLWIWTKDLKSTRGSYSCSR